VEVEYAAAEGSVGKGPRLGRDGDIGLRRRSEAPRLGDRESVRGRRR
jgi:hypothetical protein